MSVERLLWFVLLVIVLAGCVVLDLTDAVWDPNPFTTNAISGLVLAALSILLIDEYLSFRAARAWEALAAFALEDLGRVARAVWVRHASFIQPEYEAIASRSTAIRCGPRKGDVNSCSDCSKSLKIQHDATTFTAFLAGPLSAPASC